MDLILHMRPTRTRTHTCTHAHMHARTHSYWGTSQVIVVPALVCFHHFLEPAMRVRVPCFRTPTCTDVSVLRVALKLGVSGEWENNLSEPSGRKAETSGNLLRAVKLGWHAFEYCYRCWVTLHVNRCGKVDFLWRSGPASKCEQQTDDICSDCN